MAKRKSKATWLWEFSKRMVLICSALYVCGFIYTCAVMCISQDYEALSTFISEYSDVLKVCVFGYFVKAGVENAIKINRSYNGGNDNDQC